MTKKNNSGGIFWCRERGPLARIERVSANRTFHFIRNASFLRDHADGTSALPASRPTKSFPVTARPRIAAHMITAFFPITGLVVLEKAHAFYPFRRLPG